MRLTAAGKILLFLVGLGVLGYAGVDLSRSGCRRCRPQREHAGGRRPRPARPAVDHGAGRRAQGRARARAADGVLRVGMEPDAPPLHFINDRKQEDGFDFRLAGLIAEGLGAKRVQVVEADYEDLPDRLRAGDIDVIMAGYVPDPSIEGVVWSNGYLDFGLCLIVHEGMAATFRSRARPGRQAHRDLRRSGGRALGAGRTFPNARISKFSGDDGWFEAVETRSGRRADLRLSVRGRRDQGAPAHDHRASTTSTSRSTRSAFRPATSTWSTRSTRRSTSSGPRRSTPT